ncbi:hypothetical protein CEUSTIGMA_g2959.t1 [Chlamydomonas eustigma]|uniref:J domain-containing protein n=1 Tax=Chlamydomonas eustigma TaxID=1157962 RepID=A0A250WXK9_9CHLO|nr:hypothetical protein CEUSTIGMA_g2959.t1 [Chlamydomonas eustigma]|eukprot:GAX75516.1 hypothetical protein CEUSTIGMA_g2959.t1 [Chlamydomonas eustigma]
MKAGALHLFLLLASSSLLVLARKDYYEILQVSRGAGESQIKRSHRKLAVQYLPDKVTGTEEEKAAAARKFADINNAYEALSDPSKREIYDRHGEEGLKQHGQQNAGRPGGGSSIFDMCRLDDSFITNNLNDSVPQR